MRTLKLTIAYDGSKYSGWQLQHCRDKPSRSRKYRPTIQGALEEVLKRILQEKVIVVGSSRTDAGVHALGQVAHIKTKRPVSLSRLMRSINQLLPSDIAVSSIEEVESSFHARFNASKKRYRYRIFTGRVVLPFINRYVHHVTTPLNLSAMRNEIKSLHGQHNFRAFAKAGGVRGNTLRRISDVKLIRKGKEIHLEIEGNGFLRNMVRSIAGTLLDVGCGKSLKGRVKMLLCTHDRKLAGTTAPARGLVLVNVEY